MLMQAIESYLQLRRAGGYQLRDTEVLLKEFACFAAERGEIHIKADSGIAWAARATSQQQRARRLNNLILFARYIRAEDTEHQLPPAGVFAHHVRSRRLPHIFAPTQIAAILAEAKQLPPAGSLRPLTRSLGWWRPAVCASPRHSHSKSMTSVLTDFTSVRPNFEKVGLCHFIQRRQSN